MLILTDSYSIMNTQFSELSIYSHVNAQTMTVFSISNPLGLNLALYKSFGWWGQTVLKNSIMSAKLEKMIVKSYKQYENINIVIYCILTTEINIILLHWNKQYLESSIIQWRCCLFNKVVHLVLMITCFDMQIWDKLEHWAILFAL